MVSAYKVKCKHSTSEEESFLVIYLQCSCSALMKEAHESNDATSATIDVEVHDYDQPSAVSQSEDIDLYWHFGKKKN